MTRLHEQRLRKEWHKRNKIPERFLTPPESPCNGEVKIALVSKRTWATDRTNRTSVDMLRAICADHWLEVEQIMQVSSRRTLNSVENLNWSFSQIRWHLLHVRISCSPTRYDGSVASIKLSFKWTSLMTTTNKIIVFTFCRNTNWSDISRQFDWSIERKNRKIIIIKRVIRFKFGMNVNRIKSSSFSSWQVIGSDFSINLGPVGIRILTEGKY